MSHRKGQGGDVDRAARQRLIVDHVSWATWIAREYHQRWPVLDYDEMVGEAMVALVETARRYRPSKGNFRTFVAVRIRGAIKDRARRDDPAGRDSRTPAVKDRAPRHRPVRVDGDSGGLPEGRNAHLLGFPIIPPTQEYVVDARLAISRLVAAVDLLPTRDASAWRMYYLEELELEEIGKRMEVTASRVSQIITNVWRVVRAEWRVGDRPEPVRRRNSGKGKC